MVLRRGIVATVVVVNVIFQIQICLSEINRQSFPKGFVFGTAASAFQVSTFLFNIHIALL